MGKQKYATGTVQIALRLPSDLLKAVNRKAERLKVPRSEVIVSAVETVVGTRAKRGKREPVSETDAFS